MVFKVCSARVSQPAASSRAAASSASRQMRARASSDRSFPVPKSPDSATASASCASRRASSRSPHPERSTASVVRAQGSWNLAPMLAVSIQRSARGIAVSRLPSHTLTRHSAHSARQRVVTSPMPSAISMASRAMLAARAKSPRSSQLSLPLPSSQSSTSVASRARARAGRVVLVAAARTGHDASSSLIRSIHPVASISV